MFKRVIIIDNGMFNPNHTTRGDRLWEIEPVTTCVGVPSGRQRSWCFNTY